MGIPEVDRPPQNERLHERDGAWTLVIFASPAPSERGARQTAHADPRRDREHHRRKRTRQSLVVGGYIRLPTAHSLFSRVESYGDTMRMTFMKTPHNRTL